MDFSLQLSVTQTYSQFLVLSYSSKIETIPTLILKTRTMNLKTPVYEHSSSLYESSPASHHNSSERRRFHPICTVHTLCPHYAQQCTVMLIRLKARSEMELRTFVRPRSSATRKTRASQCHLQTLYLMGQKAEEFSASIGNSPVNYSYFSNTFSLMPKRRSCSVAQAGAQWHHHSSLQPQTPGFKPSSCFSLPSGYWLGLQAVPPHQANFFIL
ncbi:UPF0764 protein C16orf89 [Plecturocebus cupreus]